MVVIKKKWDNAWNSQHGTMVNNQTTLADIMIIIIIIVVATINFLWSQGFDAKNVLRHQTTRLRLSTMPKYLYGFTFIFPTQLPSLTLAWSIVNYLSS